MYRNLPKIVILALTLTLSWGIFPVQFPSNQVQAQYLQLSTEQMKAALQCPTDESKEFVDDVFELVSRGILPESLVISAFNYSYKKPKHRWVYFQKTLDLRCEKLGIDLAAEREKLHKEEEKEKK